MKNISIFLALLLAVSIATGEAIAADFYVSENGSDTSSGNLPDPKGNDGPFATLTRAHDAVRELKAQADSMDIIYYSARDPSFTEAVLAKKQREGVDKHSVAKDPMFVDPKNGDFRMKPTSPALKLGIVPIDVTKIGLRDAPRAPSQ